METLQVDEELLSTGQAQERLLESNTDTQQRTSRGRIDGKEICTCTKDRTVLTRQANASESAHCHLCGKTIQSTETHVHNGSLGLASPPSTRPPETFSNGLPALPGTFDIFLEGNNVSTGRSVGSTTSQTVLPPFAEGQGKTPVHGTYLLHYLHVVFYLRFRSPQVQRQKSLTQFVLNFINSPVLFQSSQGFLMPQNASWR